ATVMATGMWTAWTATSSGPRSRRAPARPVISGTSTSTGTAMWTAWTTGNSTAASASIEQLKKTASEVFTAKQAPHRHRPGARSARRKGRRRHSMADRLQKEIVIYVAFLDPEFPAPEFAPRPDPTSYLAAQAIGGTSVNPRIPRGSVGAVMHGFAGPERSRPSTGWRGDHLDRHRHRLRDHPRPPAQRRPPCRRPPRR